jgi:hypothetical protein
MGLRNICLFNQLIQNKDNRTAVPIQMLFLYAGVQQPTPFKTGDISRYTTQHLALIESLRNRTCCQFWIYLSCWPAIPPANFCIALAGRQLSVLLKSFAAHKWTMSRDFNQLKFIFHSLDVLNSYIYKSHWVGFCLKYWHPIIRYLTLICPKRVSRVCGSQL